MDGVLNIHKPLGLTSHDVVDHLRRVINQKEIGHTGTLDPLAEGVLVMCVGRATRLVPFLQNRAKEYHALVRLGITTTTFDGEGSEVKRILAAHISRETTEDALKAFLGKQLQLPPMHSAVRHEGVKLYELARQGVEVDRKPRVVTIDRLELIDFQPGEYPAMKILIECSAGTYIRSLAADIGSALKVGAYLEHLLRTRVGHFTLEEARPLDSLTSMETAQAASIPACDAVPHLPRWQPHPVALQKLLNGNFLQLENTLWFPGSHIAVMENGSSLALIARWLPPLLRPVRVIRA